MQEKLEQITLDIPDGYEFFGINDNNKVVLTKKQPQYPKTFEECCDIVKAKVFQTGFEYKSNLISNFQKLLICLDAYWKIAGEQMGFDKPWKPDWKDGERMKYCLHNDRYEISKCGLYLWNTILAFPTEEMRDAFYENFKDLIENCKDLL